MECVCECVPFIGSANFILTPAFLGGSLSVAKASP